MRSRRDVAIVPGRHVDWCSAVTIVTRGVCATQDVEMSTIVNDADAQLLANLIVERLHPSRVIVFGAAAGRWSAPFARDARVDVTCDETFSNPSPHDVANRSCA
jgi:hypothetical protein